MQFSEFKILAIQFRTKPMKSAASFRRKMNGPNNNVECHDIPRHHWGMLGHGINHIILPTVLQPPFKTSEHKDVRGFPIGFPITILKESQVDGEIYSIR